MQQTNKYTFIDKGIWNIDTSVSSDNTSTHILQQLLV